MNVMYPTKQKSPLTPQTKNRTATGHDPACCALKTRMKTLNLLRVESASQCNCLNMKSLEEQPI